MLGLSFEYLYADPLVLLLRPGHPLLADPGLQANPLAHLSGFTVILPTPGTAIRQTADSFFLTRGLGAPARTIETLSVPVARAYCAGSNAVWCSPAGAAQPDLQAGTLVALPVAMNGTEEMVGLTLRAEMTPGAAQTEVMAVIHALAAARRGQTQAGDGPPHSRG